MPGPPSFADLRRPANHAGRPGAHPPQRACSACARSGAKPALLRIHHELAYLWRPPSPRHPITL
nr:unnamed protein product [Digitaria exilis]